MRTATDADAAACAAVYAPYVTDTAISFESVPPDTAEMQRRIAVARAHHAWLVLDSDDGDGATVAGYAYAGPHKTRDAYRWTCEVSVYVRRDVRGRGAGRMLYEALFARLADRGFRTAVAGMTLPNEASAALHRALGFEPIGVFRSVGHKLGSWHDVAYVQRRLDAGGAPEDSPPRPIMPA